MKAEVNFKTPEAALQALEDAYRANDIKAAIKAKDFKMEATLMLEKGEQRFDRNPDLVEKTARVLELSYRNDVKKNGFIDMRNTTCRIVDKQPYEGRKDVFVVTEECAFPNGTRPKQRVLLYNGPAGWRVLNAL